MKKLLLIILIFIISGCARERFRLFQTHKSNKQQTYTKKVVKYYSYTPTYKKNVSIDYKILKNDRLLVIIYKHPDLIPQTLQQRGILVDNNGYVSLPLIGRVRVAGLTQTEAAKKLEREYSKYLKRPYLNVEVLNKRIYVLGEVKKPGAIEVDKERLTILEAIALAGDLTDSAKRDDIIIISKDRYGRMQLRHLDLTDFSRLATSNIILKPNDIVYVQPNSAKEFNAVNQRRVVPFDLLNRVIAPFVSLKNLTN